MEKNKNRKIIALAAACLLVATIAFAQEKIYDGPVYMIMAEISKDDTALLKNIKAGYATENGFSSLDRGYYLEVVSYDQRVIYKKNLAVSFYIAVELKTDEPLPTIQQPDKVEVFIRVPYFPEAARIVIRHGTKILLDIDLRKEMCNKNSLCDLGENPRTCPEDCREAGIGCVPEGGILNASGVAMGIERCCEGLRAISCEGPDASGACKQTKCATFLCAKCGDGSCGAGENSCNCPEDCRIATTTTLNMAANATKVCGNGVCEPKRGENFLTCPEDCRSGSADKYCDKVKDDICDPDCAGGADSDCGLAYLLDYWPYAVILLALLIVVFIIYKKTQTQGE